MDDAGIKTRFRSNDTRAMEKKPWQFSHNITWGCRENDLIKDDTIYLTYRDKKKIT